MPFFYRSLAHDLAKVIANVTGAYSDQHFRLFATKIPSAPTTAETSNPLAEFELPPNSLRAHYSGYVSLEYPIATTVLRSGSATWWQLSGTQEFTQRPIITGTISNNAGNGDIRLPSTELFLGDPITLRSFNVYPLRITNSG